MGIVASDNGISLQFCDVDGKPDGAPLYGRYSAFYGQPREKVIGAGAPQTPDEGKFKGSTDWLTLVAVADTEERLQDILHQTNVSPIPPLTSCSSRRVCIEMHIGGTRQKLEGRITVASGAIVSLVPDHLRIDAAHVKVLPPGAELEKMDKTSPFYMEFVGGSIALNQLVQAMAKHPEEFTGGSL